MPREPIQVKKEQLVRYMAYRECFESDAGKIVLQDLEDEYGGQCFVPGDPDATLRKAYFRDFLDAIKEVVKRAEGSFEIIEEPEEEE